MSKKKKRTKKKIQTSKVNKKNKKKILLYSVIGSLVVVFIIAISFATSMLNAKNADLYDINWRSVSAKNASGDEVDMITEIYNVKYSSYQGSLNFNDNGTFDLWLSPGQPEDGTHTGSFTIKDDSTIDVVFDDGTVTSFETIRENDKITSVVVKYNDCDVYFTK